MPPSSTNPSRRPSSSPVPPVLFLFRQSNCLCLPCSFFLLINFLQHKPASLGLHCLVPGYCTSLKTKICCVRLTMTFVRAAFDSSVAPAGDHFHPVASLDNRITWLCWHQLQPNAILLWLLCLIDGFQTTDLTCSTWSQSLQDALYHHPRLLHGFLEMRGVASWQI